MASKAWFRKRRIGVLMGGVSEEREISLKTGAAVLEALTGRGYDAVGIDAGRDLAARLAAEGVEVAFVALHGRHGEDGCVQGMLEVMGIPYTGSGVRASSVAMDKLAAKKVFRFHGISTPPFSLVGEDGRFAGVRTPLVVKPVSQGSAIGVSVVRKRPELKAALAAARRFGEVMVERYIEGREITVSILDGEALPLIEIRPKEGFYDYRAKYTKGLTEFVVPARIGRRAQGAAVRESLAAYRALGCSGAARVDVMLDGDGTPFVLEVNTIPGMTQMSLLPRAAASAGLSYPALVEAMLLGAGLDKI